jgi:hypothetical protein
LVILKSGLFNAKNTGSRIKFKVKNVSPNWPHRFSKNRKNCEVTYQLKNLARLNYRKKVIAEESKRGVEALCKAKTLFAPLMHLCQKTIIQLNDAPKNAFLQL